MFVCVCFSYQRGEPAWHTGLIHPNINHSTCSLQCQVQNWHALSIISSQLLADAANCLTYWVLVDLLKSIWKKPSSSSKNHFRLLNFSQNNVKMLLSCLHKERLLPYRSIRQSITVGSEVEKWLRGCCSREQWKNLEFFISIFCPSPLPVFLIYNQGSRHFTKIES